MKYHKFTLNNKQENQNKINNIYAVVALTAFAQGIILGAILASIALQFSPDQNLNCAPLNIYALIHQPEHLFYDSTNFIRTPENNKKNDDFFTAPRTRYNPTIQQKIQHALNPFKY